MPAVLAMVVACQSDKSTGIVDHLEAPRNVLVAPTSSTASVMTISDAATGHVYTLNLADAKLTWSGAPDEEIRLDEEELGIFATFFQETVEADQLAGELETEANSYTPSGDEPCGPFIDGEPPECVEPMRNPVGSSAYAGVTMMRVVDSSNRSRLSQSGPAGPHSREGWRSSPAIESVSGALSSFNIDPCADVVNAIQADVSQYRLIRNQPLLETITSAVVGEVANGITGKVLPPGVAAAGGIAVKLAERKMASFKLGYYAWRWNTYNCSNRQFVAGPFIRGWGPVGDPRFHLVCHQEQWILTWPNGDEHAFNATVCEYMMS